MCALQLCVKLEKTLINQEKSKKTIIQDVVELKKQISEVI